MFRKLFALLAVSATASAGLVAAQAAATSGAAPSASAADAAAFNPGNLISDENFYDGLAMTAEEVQAFLESRNSSGDPTALRNYVQRTPSLPADEHCAAYEGAESESAASIIARVGEACNLSPKAMLVLLEKEQSLVSMTSPTEGRLAAATGFGCPDTAPCDASVAGFFYQIYYAARQFQVYRAEPYNYNHVAGATNNILYNPNFACGSAPVHIENDATAGLYNYTPYQPNQAALANLYGEGDDCSAYGNRNFWSTYTDWFGDPHAATESTGSLVQTEEDGEIFLDVAGTRHRVPAEHLPAYEALGRVRTIPAEELQAMPQGTDAGSIVKGAHGWIYLLGADGKRWTFPDCEMVAAFGGSCDDAVQITDEQFGKYAFAGTVQPLVRTPEGMSLYVEGGVKREVTGLGVLKVRGYDTAKQVMQLDAAAISHLPYGEPMWGVGAVVAGESEDSAPLILDGEGTALEVPESMREFPWLSPTTISDETYGKITVKGSLAPAMTDGTDFYLASERGMLRVNRAQYGTAMKYENIPASFAKHVRIVRGVDGPHLAQEIGSEEVSIVSGGQRSSFPNTAGAEGEARKRGVDTTIHRIVPGVLEHVTVGNGVGNGALLMPESGDDLFILDGAHLQAVASAEIAGELGFSMTPMRVTQASFDKIPQREGVLEGTQLRCGEQEWIAFGGKRYAFASSQLQAAYGLKGHAVSSTLCSLIPAASEPIGDFLKGSDDKVYWIDGGKRRAVASPEIVAEMGGEERVMPEPSDAALQQIPEGEPLTAVPAGYAPPVSTQAPAAPQQPANEAPATPQPTAPATDQGGQAEQTQAGEVLTNPAGSGVWLRAGDGLVQIGSQAVADALGLDVRAPRAVTQATIDSFRGKTQPLYVPAVRCGGVSYLGIEGELVPYASADAERAFGLEHVELAPETCAALTVSLDRTMGQDARMPDGTPVRIEGGKLRPVVAPAPSEEPTMTEPPASEPAPAGMQEPASTQPAGSDPASTQPASTEPASTQPAGTDPASTDPASTQPAGTEPASTAPVDAEPAGPAPAGTDPAATQEAEQAPELLILPIELISALERGEPVTA